MNKKIWGDFPIHVLGGHEFQAVPRSQLPFAADRGLGDDHTEVLMPVRRPRDEKLDFPGQAPLEGAGPFLKGGISKHKVDFMARPDLWKFEIKDVGDLKPLGGSNSGVTARELVIFAEDDWYGECFQVLTAHGWWVGASTAKELLDQVVEIEGNPHLIEDARDMYGENFECYLLEVVAKHFAAPLSRLWYAANMMSLYYAHNDDMRVGYLWAEYQVKMHAELFALKHIQMTERNRENGAKGGQTAKKDERYQVLDHLMRARVGDFLTANDRGRVRLAKSLAAEHDEDASDPLFLERGKALSPAWYQDWVDHFRHQLSRTSAISGT